MKLYLVRHGETEYNVQARFLGRTDGDLSEIGLGQAREAAQQLAGVNVRAVFSSDLRRARVTAELIAAQHGVDVVPVPEFREIDFGAWEGLTYAEIEALDKEYVAQWVKDPFTVDIPGGETWQAFKRRVLGTLNRIVAVHTDIVEHGEATAPHNEIIIVAHGGPIRLIVTVLQNDEREVFKTFWPKPGSITAIELT